jgi:GLEYA domain
LAKLRFINSSSATDSNVIGNRDMEMFTVEWTGYFYTGSYDGVFTFYVNSDDGSYLWIGSNAESGYTNSNCVVCNGGTHRILRASGTITLSSYSSYAIRILYGQSLYEYEISTYFKTPTGNTYYNGNGFYYSKPPGMGFELIRTLLYCLLGHELKP